MKNNLMDAAALGDILRRVERLQPGDAARWGSMSVSGMMNHCNKIHQAVLTGQAPDDRPTLKQRLMKTMALRLMPQLPKNIRTPAKATLPDADTGLHLIPKKRSSCTRSMHWPRAGSGCTSGIRYSAS